MRKIAMVVWNSMVHDARVTKEAQTLARAGFKVSVFCLRDGVSQAEHEYPESGFSIRRINRTPFRFAVLNMMIVQVRLLVAMVRYRPDFVHGHDVNTLPLAWLAAFLSRAALVYDAHEISGDREGYRKLRCFVYLIEKTFMRSARAVITTTTLRAKYFARTYKRERPVVLQNRPRQMNAGSAMDKQFLRQRFNIGSDQVVLIYQGGLQQGRGLETLIDAIQDVPSCVLVLVGDGRLKGALLKRIAFNGLENRVFLFPMVPLEQLPSITGSADIGVQPIENTCLNHYTTDSNKLFEYLHAGLPVIASDLPEIAKVVKSCDCGLLFKPGDGIALRAALNAAISDVGKRRQLAHNAVRASERYSWENQEHILLSIYAADEKKDKPSHGG